MQQANELLYGILQVVGRIEQNMKGGGQPAGAPAAAPKEPKSTASLLSNLGAGLSSFKGANPKTIKTFFSFMDQMLISADKVKKGGSGLKDLSMSMMNLGQALPGMTAGIERISSIRNINGALGNMQSLFNFIDYNGRLITAKVAKSIKDISIFMINLGQSLPGIASGLDTIGKLKAKVIDKALFNLRKLFDFLREAGKKKSSDNVKILTEALGALVKAIPGLEAGISSIAKIKEKSMAMALKSLGMLFTFIEDKGKPGTSKISKSIKDISIFMINLGQSLPGIGSGLDLIGKLKAKVIDKALFNLRKLFDFIQLQAKKKGNSDIKVLSESLEALVKAMPGLTAGVNSIAKIKEKTMAAALKSLGFLFHFIEEKGKPATAKKIQKGIDVMNKASKALRGFNVLKDIGEGFMYLGLGIVAFAGSFVLAGMLLSLAKPSDVLPFLGMTIIALLVAFGALHLAAKFVKGGTSVIKDMGLGLAALALGIISFALTIRLLPLIFKGESNGSIIKGMLIMVGIIGIMALAFAALDLAKPFVDGGFKTILLMSAGLAIFAITVLGLAMVAKMLMTGMTFDKNAGKEEKDENKKSMVKGLGIFGLVLLGAIAAFSLLGIPGLSTIIKSGAITMMLMGGALFVMALSIQKLVEVGEQLAGKDVAGTLTNLIGGTINGFIGGLSALSGGKTGVAGIAAFMKNSAKIFAGVAILVSMSVALSLFAWSLTAFAELGNMRVVTGTDKNGKPIFGEKINVEQVGRTMTATLSSFLTGLIESTGQLTMSKAKALKKLGRALTGRRGILSAIHDFAELLKTFAQFGPAGEIGYVDFVPDGVNEDGNAKFKQVPSKVKITVVAKNIADSFGTFVDELTKHTAMFEFTGSKGKSMQQLASILLGTKYFKVFGLSFGREKPGLLEPIMKFGEILKTFGQFGNTGEIPILDAQGKVIDKVKVTDVASHIVANLSSFSTTLGSSNLTGDVEKAEKNIGKVSGIIESLSKFSESLDSLQKMGDSVSNLARSITELSVSLDGFDSAKLTKLGSIRVATGGPSASEQAGNTTADNIDKKSQSMKGAPAAAESMPINWDLVAAQIGQHVGSSIVDAMKAGQVKFEFSPSGQGKGVLSFD